LTTETESKQEVWQVITVSNEDFPVKAGMTMTMSENYVKFTYGEQTVGYSILKSNDRLVMETDTTRLLFRIEKTTDSTLTFLELYSKQPLTLSLIRITNHKKHEK
jgi:hypothetical protein